MPSVAAFVFSALMLAGCEAEHGANASATHDAADATEAPFTTVHEPASPALPSTDVATRYACSASVTVDILHSGNARMTLADGRDVDLAHIAGSTPQSFAGSGVYFTLQGDGGFLTQEKGASELACTPQATSRPDASAQHSSAQRLPAGAPDAPAQDAM